VAVEMLQKQSTPLQAQFKCM